MCDYSLHNVKSRAARVGDKLTTRSEEHTSELQSHSDLVCRLLLEKKKKHVLTSLLQQSRIPPAACKPGTTRAPPPQALKSRAAAPGVSTCTPPQLAAYIRSLRRRR